MTLSADQIGIFDRAVASIAAARQSLSKPILYGPDGRGLPPSSLWKIQRSAAKHKGSMRNWRPQRIVDEQIERETIADRVTDLIQGDAHAAGLQGNFAYTVIGAGLQPHPLIDRDAIPGIDKEEARVIQSQMRAIYKLWDPFADAGGRRSFGGIQFLLEASLFQFGEYLMLLPMLSDPTRPYSLACQVVNPKRLKTPVDLRNTNIRDGIELGEYGQPVAYWIKKADPVKTSLYTADVSTNFLRVPAKRGHRRLVIHNFVARDPEDVRGWPILAPAVKLFRDFSDLIDAELVSNVVTAAFSLWIETGKGDNPLTLAQIMASETVNGINADGNAESTRYQEMVPGAIMYGDNGQVPHAIAANRPGTTFDPFLKNLKKAIAMAADLPYPVAFRDVENVNFAGFRSAMLDAWRVFMTHRSVMGMMTCQPILTMLMEEAYLRGNLDFAGEDFYSNMHGLTRSEWRGSPKGDIEPVKAVQADVLAIQNRLKTRAKAIAENGDEWRAVFEQLEEEEAELEARGLRVDPSTAQAVPIDNSNPDEGQQNG